MDRNVIYVVKEVKRLSGKRRVSKIVLFDCWRAVQTDRI